MRANYNNPFKPRPNRINGCSSPFVELPKKSRSEPPPDPNNDDEPIELVFEIEVPLSLIILIIFALILLNQ